MKRLTVFLAAALLASPLLATSVVVTSGQGPSVIVPGTDAGGNASNLAVPAMVPVDASGAVIPAAVGTVTSVDVSGGTTGLTTSGGPVTTSGTITLAGTLSTANGGTGNTTGTATINANSTGFITSIGNATSFGSATSFGLSGNISAPAWTTSGIRYKNVAATLTDTTSSGTVAAAYSNVFGANTIAASAATTFTNYYNSYFAKATAGTNVTLGTSWALRADNLSVTDNTASTSTTNGALVVAGGLGIGGDLQIAINQGIHIASVMDVNQATSGGIFQTSAKALGISNSTTTFSTLDTRLSREAAGIWSVDTTANGNGLGSIHALIQRKGFTVSTLPTGATGLQAYVTDAVACTFLATPTGGSNVFCPVIYNGSAWVAD